MSENESALTIIEDSREQHPLDFAPFAPFGIAVERRKLRCGDYTLRGWEHHLMIERKSLNDVVGTLTRGRERFTREVYDRAAYIPSKHLVVEASWQDLSRPFAFAPCVNPLSIVNSIYTLMMPPTSMCVFCHPSRAMIAWYVVKVCENFHRRMTHGSSGMWRAIFAEDAADLAPIPYPYQTIGD